ncbi:MAG TPA: ATP-binding protein, partial [Pseudonocardiaceae bacterium]|nr:ATP-binding protein [Pseudonocardiaceae bacterium]
RMAVRDAVREAMRNTMKHAGTTEVVLRVEHRDQGVAVIARDHGTGFDEADRPPGFGISNSIMARLAEVGGTSTVESSPGRGTRVTLWVPL